jgi:hypothetical protein
VPSKETQGLRKLENHKNSRSVKPTNCTTPNPQYYLNHQRPHRTTKFVWKKAIETFPYLERGAPKQLNIEHNV